MLEAILLTLIAINTGFSYEAPFASVKSVVTLLVVIIVWIAALTGHLT